MARTPSPWVAYDAQVRAAWLERRLSDGTALDLGATNIEQGFVVTPAGTRAIPLNRQGWQACADGSRRRAGTLNLSAILPNAGGHTHPLGARGDIWAGVPGDEDGLIAARTGKPAYVISADRAMAIEARGRNFDVRVVAGRPFAPEERDLVRRRTGIWGRYSGGSGVTCTFTPD